VPCGEALEPSDTLRLTQTHCRILNNPIAVSPVDLFSDMDRNTQSARHLGWVGATVRCNGFAVASAWRRQDVVTMTCDANQLDTLDSASWTSHGRAMAAHVGSENHRMSSATMASGALEACGCRNIGAVACL